VVPRAGGELGRGVFEDALFSFRFFPFFLGDFCTEGDVFFVFDLALVRVAFGLRLVFVACFGFVSLFLGCFGTSEKIRRAQGLGRR